MGKIEKTEAPALRFDVPYEISRRRLADIMTTAIEGGFSSWLLQIQPGSPAHKPDCEDDHGMPWYARASFYNPGWAIKFQYDKESDLEGAGTGRATLGAAKFTRGARILVKKYPHLWREIVAEDEDAISADAFLQAAVFGDVIYG